MPAPVFLLARDSGPARAVCVRRESPGLIGETGSRSGTPAGGVLRMAVSVVGARVSRKQAALAVGALRCLAARVLTAVPEPATRRLGFLLQG